MTRKTILRLVTQMNHFKQLATATLADMGDRDSMISGTKNSGALRRCSMEITRTLAELRAGR